MAITIKEIVKDSNKATFSHYRQGNMFYTVRVDGILFSFPVSLADIGSASLMAEEKAITLMRYIRRTMEDGTFVSVGG